jgi:hypothetical protein
MTDWYEQDELEGDVACDLCHQKWRSWVWKSCPRCDPDESLGNVSCMACHRRWRTATCSFCPHCRRREWAAECKVEHALLFGRMVKPPSRVQ